MGSNSYQFAQRAIEDLDDILSYISFTLANPIAAKGFYDALFTKIDYLCLFPEHCEAVENIFLNRAEVRKALVQNYLAYYTFDAEKGMVTILRIVSVKRNIEEIRIPGQGLRRR